MELLVYVAVLAIIVSTVATLFFWTISSANKTQATQETVDSVKFALEVMSYEIRAADAVYDPTTVFNSNPGQLSLETSLFLPSGENISYVDFYLCDGRLCLKRESQAPIAITSNKVTVSSLTFKKIITGGAVSVGIEIGADYINPGGRPELQAIISASSTVALRKY